MDAERKHRREAAVRRMYRPILEALAAERGDHQSASATGLWLPASGVRRAAAVERVTRALGKEQVARLTLPDAALPTLAFAALYENAAIGRGTPLLDKRASASQGISALRSWGSLFDARDEAMLERAILATYEREVMKEITRQSVGAFDSSSDPQIPGYPDVKDTAQRVLADAVYARMGSRDEPYDGLLEFVEQEMARLPREARPRSAQQLTRMPIDLNRLDDFVFRRRRTLESHQFYLPESRMLSEEGRRRNHTLWQHLRERIELAADHGARPGEAVVLGLGHAAKLSSGARPPSAPKSQGTASRSPTRRPRVAATNVVHEDEPPTRALPGAETDDRPSPADPEPPRPPTRREPGSGL